MPVAVPERTTPKELHGQRDFVEVRLESFMKIDQDRAQWMRVGFLITKTIIFSAKAL